MLYLKVFGVMIKTNKKYCSRTDSLLYYTKQFTHGSLIRRKMKAEKRIIRTMRIGFLVISVFVILVGVLSHVTTEQANEIQLQITETNDIVQHSNDSLVDLSDLIGAERGYVLTGRSVYLVRVESATDSLQNHLDALFLLTQDRPMHQRRLEHVQRAFNSLQEQVVKPLLTHYRDSSETQMEAASVAEFEGYTSLSRFYKEEMHRLLSALNTEARLDLERMVAVTVRNLNAERMVNILGTILVLFIILAIQRTAVVTIRRANSAQEKLERDLKRNRDRLEDVIEGTRAGTWEWDIRTDSIELNERWAEIIGYTLEELKPTSLQTIKDHMHPKDVARSDKLFRRVLDKEIDYYDFEGRMRHKDGHWVWIRDRGKIVEWDTAGNPIRMSGTHDDISDRKMIERQLFLEKEQLETTLLSVGDGIITTDSQGMVEIMNGVAEELTGWSSHDAEGEPFTSVFVTRDAKSGGTGDNPVARVLATRMRTELYEDTILIAKTGEERFIEDSAAPIIDQNDLIAGVVLVFRDSTEKRIEREHMIKIGLTDQLTQVHNRRGYEQILAQFDRESRYPISFIIADVNGLKLANDAFGHDMGDDLLMRVATVLTAQSRPSDAVVRLGGDEFVVLMPETPLSEAEARMAGFEATMKREHIGPLPVSVSFGASEKRSATADNGMVLRKAESRMYKEKIIESPRVKTEIIERLLAYQHKKYPFEQLHTNRVVLLSELLAREADMTADDIEMIKTIARYHDIGKIAIDQKLLQKDYALDEEEWFDVRRHAEVGYNLLRSVPSLYETATGVLHHHEWWDGTGYPRGLAGEEIPIGSRIVALCDSYEAMIGIRTYGTPRSPAEAMTEIESCSGTQFDPHLVSLVPKAAFENLVQNYDGQDR